MALHGLGLGEFEDELADCRAGFMAFLPTATLCFHLHPLQLFNDAIRLAVSYKQNSQDFMDEVLQELEVGQAKF